MILCEHFVYVHFPKTGGNFLRHLFAEHAPAHWEVQMLEGHPPGSKAPPHYQALPLVGVIRNPFAWYVSWYDFQRNILKTPFFLELSANDTRSFKETIMATLELDYDSFFGRDYSGHPGLGSYSAYLYYMFGFDLASVHFASFENLRQDLLATFEHFVAVPDPMRQALLHAPDINAAPEKDYRAYYDAELRECIEQRDRLILDTFGYSFD